MKRGKYKRRKHIPSICSGAMADIMKEQKITSIKMAEDLHINVYTVYMWRRGERIPRLDTAVTIADYLGVDLNTLCGR